MFKKEATVMVGIGLCEEEGRYCGQVIWAPRGQELLLGFPLSHRKKIFLTFGAFVFISKQY